MDAEGIDEGKRGKLEMYEFPGLEVLADVPESEFRDIGYGYTARYMTDSLSQVKSNGGEEWLRSLIGRSKLQIQNDLTSLNGVGRKIADCIALLSLERLESIPIDRNVCELYQAETGDLQATCSNKERYDTVQAYFADQFRGTSG